MPKLSNNKIINHHFHVDNDEGESGIGYDMIVCRYLMIQLGLTDKFKRQFLQWDGATANMKESRNFLGQSDLSKRKICKVMMQIAEPTSTKEATKRMVKILNSTYAKADLEHVVNTSQLNA